MTEEWGFAPPPFNPDAALLRLRRELQALGLAERGGHFERRGLPVIQARVEGDTLVVQRTRTPARSPQWHAMTLRDHAQLRDFIAQTQKTLAAWSDSDD